MIDHKKYFDRLHEIIGKTKSADIIIEENWRVVVGEMNQLLSEYAKLQEETGTRYEISTRDG